MSSVLTVALTPSQSVYAQLQNIDPNPGRPLQVDEEAGEKENISLSALARKALKSELPAMRRRVGLS